MSETIEITDAMVDAGIDALNVLRTSERFVQRREAVEMTWADIVTAAYVGMERRRRLDLHLAQVMEDIRVAGNA